jgi:hypothetical protein
MSGVTDKQIEQLGIAKITPLHPEDELKKAGAVYQWYIPPASAPGVLASATSALEAGSRLPHLHWDWARPSHICTGTGLAYSPLPQLSSRVRLRSLAVTSLALLHSCSKHGVVTDLLENDVVVDGRIVTGQNQMGSCQVSQLLMQMVQSRKVSA